MNELNKNDLLEKLLCFGFISEKLDSIFSSEEFGNWVLNNNIENHLEIYKSLSNGQKKKYYSKTYFYLTYKLTRNNNAPRYLAMPHPIAYIHLAREIKYSWNKIKNNILTVDNYKNISMIIPTSDNKNRRLISLKSYNKNDNENHLIITKQLGKKYFIHADISTCYPSIYTHSIPWALVGKNISKKKRNNKFFFNRIDTLVRNSQDGETLGLQIGTDTSGLIAELILSKIDKELLDFDYIRFIDDYKCFTKTKEEADNFILSLSKELEKYKLKLNTKKTKIVELPQTLNDNWVRQLKTFNFNRNDNHKIEVNKNNYNTILDYLDLSIDLLKKYPNDSSLKYAIKVISKVIYNDYASFELILNRIFGICYIYPYIIDDLDKLFQISRFFIFNNTTFKNTLSTFINIMFKEHIKNSHSDILTWLIYYSIKYDIIIDDFNIYSNLILDKEDCIPLLMSYIYDKIHLNDLRPYKKLFQNKIYLESDEWWLFIYEIIRIESNINYFTSLSLKIDRKGFYIKMKENNITFLNDIITEKLGEL